MENSPRTFHFFPIKIFLIIYGVVLSKYPPEINDPYAAGVVQLV
jgi:hypothetical protein